MTLFVLHITCCRITDEVSKPAASQKNNRAKRERSKRLVMRQSINRARRVKIQRVVLRQSNYKAKRVQGQRVFFLR